MEYVVGVKSEIPEKKLNIRLYRKVGEDKYELIKIITVSFKNPGTQAVEDNPKTTSGDPIICSFNLISVFVLNEAGGPYGPFTLDDANKKINLILLNARNYFIEHIPDNTHPLLRL